MLPLTPVQFKDKFKKDLARGSLFEDFVADYFERRGWSVQSAVGNTPQYDMIITRGQTSITLELKHDIMSDATGNYCLEKKSLEQTKSDYLIIGTPNLAYILPIEEARKLFNEYPKRQTGDFADNFSALVPKQVFTKFQSL